MEISEGLQAFLQIGIVGVALSGIVEWIQFKYQVGSGKTKALTVALAVVIGGFYHFFSETAWYVDIVGVLAAASLVYALFINKGSKTTGGEV